MGPGQLRSTKHFAPPFRRMSLGTNATPDVDMALKICFFVLVASNTSCEIRGGFEYNMFCMVSLYLGSGPVLDAKTTTNLP